MLELLHEGGPPAKLVLLLGVMALASAGLFVRRPRRPTLAFLGAVSVAIVCTMIGGVAAGVGWSISGLPLLPDGEKPRWLVYLLLGFGESLAVVVLGAGFLAVAWLLVAIASLRLAARPRDE